MKALSASVATLVLAPLVACSSSSAPKTAESAPSTTTTSASTAPSSTPPAAPSPSVALPAGVPDTAAGHALAWVLSALANSPTEAELTRHFDAAFLAQVPPAQGVPDETQGYSFIGFKGGSEPGVMNLTWLLQRRGEGNTPGKWLFLTFGFNDTTTAIDDAKALSLATAARNLLAKP